MLSELSTATNFPAELCSTQFSDRALYEGVTVNFRECFMFPTMLFEVVTALECRMSGPWRSPGRDREAATFPTPVPRWLKHNLARPHQVNGDWKWTLLLWMTLFSLGVGFPKR